MIDMFRPMRRIKQQLSDDEALKVLKNAKRECRSGDSKKRRKERMLAGMIH